MSSDDRGCGREREGDSWCKGSGGKEGEQRETRDGSPPGSPSNSPPSLLCGSTQGEKVSRHPLRGDTEVEGYPSESSVDPRVCCVKEGNRTIGSPSPLKDDNE